MKKLNGSDRTIIEAAIAALNDLGVSARARHLSGDKGADAVITLQHGRQRQQYRAEVKRRLSPTLIGPISLSFADPGDKRLLITDYATPPIAEALRLRGIQFVDAAGNAFLNTEELFIVISGRRSMKTPARHSLRVFRRSGLKVIFVLLSAPSLVSAPLRAIAEVATVSLGSVAVILDGLRELGFLVELDDTRRIVDRSRLIDEWTEGHARVLQPTLELGRFSAKTTDWWKHVDPKKYGVQWGGETAAAVLQKDLRPERTVIYSNIIPARLVNEQRLKADPAGRVIIRRRFWNAVPSPSPEVVPSLLIYGDLVAAGDGRSLAAAKTIRAAYVD